MAISLISTTSSHQKISEIPIVRDDGARVAWIGSVSPADFQCRAEFSQRFILLYVK
jgi:hypothetical protein